MIDLLFIACDFGLKYSYSSLATFLFGLYVRTQILKSFGVLSAAIVLIEDLEKDKENKMILT